MAEISNNPTESEGLAGSGNLGEIINSILQTLNSDDDMEVLAALSQLSTTLSMAPEDSFSTVSIENLIGSLVECLTRSFPDISLFALMSINSIFDSVANSVNVFAAAGGIPPLCAKLQNFEYIDMAEHAIKTLERLAFDHSTTILNEGIFATLINMMDFFEKNIQMKILSCAVTIASTVTSEELLINHILPVVPVISSTLQYRGTESLEMNKLGLRFFSVLGESVLRISGTDTYKLKKYLESIIEYGTLSNLIELVSANNEFKLPCFKLIRRLCEYSAQIVFLFHQIGGISVVNSVLGSEDPQAELPLYYLEAINFVEALLPKDSTDFELLEYYTLNSHLLLSLREIIFPRILQIYEQSVNKNIRQALLNIVRKIIQFSDSNFSLTGITHSEFACFTSEVMNCKSLEPIRIILSIILLLYEKIPDKISYSFLREGVAEKIEELIKPNTIKELVEPYSSLYELINCPGLDIKKFLLKSAISQDSFMLAEVIKWGKSQQELIQKSDPLVVESISKECFYEKICEIALNELNKIINEIKIQIQLHYKPDALAVGNELKNLVKDIESSNTTEWFDKLRDLLNQDEGITLHEVVASNLVSVLWNYLAQDYSTNIKVVTSRIQEFLVSFKATSRSGKTFLEILTTILVNLLKYVQHFTIMLYESSGPSSNLMALKSLSGRLKVTFLYQPNNEPIHPELALQHIFFSNIGSFTVTIEAFHVFDIISQALIKIKNQHSLETFIGAFERNSVENRNINQGQLNMVRQQLRLQQIFLDKGDLLLALEEKGIRSEGNEQLIKSMREKKDSAHIFGDDEDIEDEPHIQTTYLDNRKESAVDMRDIKVKLFIGDTEISKYATVFEYNSRGNGEEALLVNFFYVVDDEKIEPAQPVLITGLCQELIKSASSTPLPKNEKVYNPICLLKLIHSLNSNINNFLSANSVIFGSVSSPCTSMSLSTFASHKLSALLGKQTSDMLAMIGGMAPDWIKALPLHSPHLFNFSQRFEFFRAAAFGGGRSLHFYSQLKKNFTVRMLRQKAMVPRHGILEAGMKILSDPGLLRFGLLEFDFEGEEGTGTGPTLEFYTLISNELRKINIWRDTGEANGLFPAPIQSQDIEKVVQMFSFIGRLVAKALYDDRLLNLPFNKAFWKLVLGKPMNLLDLESVDINIGRYILELNQVVKNKQQIRDEHSDPDIQEKHIKRLDLKGVRIEDMHLNFTLPGYEHIELKPNGKNICVTVDNIESYIALVAEQTLLQNCQAIAFRKGFEKLISIEMLNVFEYDELESVICGGGSECWEFEYLKTAIIPAHGYTRSSNVFKNLLKLISCFNIEDRKMFLQFVTGCPRLPIGGFKSLTPPLTVVRKLPTNINISPDKYLPSVMTCQNYLKIPEYSSYDVLEKQLRYAFTEAKEAFHLS